MTEKYYIIQGGSSQGPYTVEELKQMGLPASTPLRQYGGPATFTLRQVLGNVSTHNANEETRMTPAEPSRSCEPPTLPYHEDNAGEPRLSLWGYFTKCMKNYVNFKGRARRREYWGFVLFSSLIAFGIALVIGFSSVSLNLDDASSRVITWIVALPFLLPQLAVACRRFHDLDRSTSNFVLLYAIPIIVSNFFSQVESTIFLLIRSACGIALLVCLILFCTDSIEGDTDYGPDPKAAERE